MKETTTAENLQALLAYYDSFDRGGLFGLSL
jgi:hypothetical protein